MEARWLKPDEARALLGLPDRQFERLVAAGWIEGTGTGTGKRYRADHVHACALLWHCIRPTLPEAKVPPEDES